MSRVLRVLALGLLVLFAFGRSTSSQVLAQAASGLQLPALPDPVPVQLDAATTAFLALDFLDSNCGTRPSCVATLPAVANALAAARAANVPVFYTVFGTSTVLPDVAPLTETPIESFGGDKFYNTNLDDLLKQAGVKTLVLTGTSTNNAIMYTSFEAMLRGYTVVVAADGVSASTDLDNALALFQMVDRTGSGNPQNVPLKPNAVTLTRTDLITYQ